MTIPTNYYSFRQSILEERAAVREAVLDFVESFRSADPPRFVTALEGLDYNPKAWKIALRAAARIDDVPAAMREVMLRLWIHAGDSIRQAVMDDILLCNTLRKLLPPYTGRSVRLYRGETKLNRRRRTYGLSWTDDRLVAESFARDNEPFCDGGTVVLETLTLPDATICAPGLCGLVSLPHENEDEYLVDRRRLGTITIAV